MAKRSILMLALLASILAFGLGWPTPSHADCTYTTTALSPGVSASESSTLRIQGVNSAVLRKPNTPCATNPNAGKIGIFVMHSFSSYSGFSACSALAIKGYVTLCADSTFTNRNEDYKGYEDHAPGIRAGINYLRGITGIQKVIIFGHSMGAPMMAFYQNVAENGAATACQGPEKIIACDATNLANLPKADGVILFDAHLGDALATLTYVDPAINNEKTPGIRNPSLDMFDPRNGYNTATNGATYSDSFKERFLQGQADRNADLLDDAVSQWSDILAGKKQSYPDDMPFFAAGTHAARLWQPDLSLLKCTKQPHTLLSRSGATIDTTPNPVCSVRAPSGAGDSGETYGGATWNVSVRVWLGAHALRTNGPYTQTINDITGIDYDSSATSSVTAVKGVGRHPNGSNATTPILIIANTGHYFLRPDEIVYENAFTPDKTIAFEEGAVHGGTPCLPCATAIDPTITTQAQANAYWGDTLGRTYSFMDQWLSKPGRFLP